MRVDDPGVRLISRLVTLFVCLVLHALGMCVAFNAAVVSGCPRPLPALCCCGFHSCLQLEAYEEAQKYKQGKFILEKQRMDKEPGWT